MLNARRLPAVALLLSAPAILSPVAAQAFELSGAWASQTDLCTLVFTKKGNQIVFTELSDLFGSGFIVEGNRIRGKSTKCMIKSQKQSGDSLEVATACATSIMNSSVRFNLKIIDDNNIDRQFPEIAGMTLKYSRCSL